MPGSGIGEFHIEANCDEAEPPQSIWSRPVSETYLQLISTQPDFVPTEAARARVVAFVKEAVPHATVEAEVTEEPLFINAGQLFEGIRCPACDDELSTDWWHDAMDVAWPDRLLTAEFQPPCCGAPVKLNDLAFDPPQGYAKFSVGVFGETWSVAEDLRRGVELILQAPVRIVWHRT